MLKRISRNRTLVVQSGFSFFPDEEMPIGKKKSSFQRQRFLRIQRDAGEEKAINEPHFLADRDLFSLGGISRPRRKTLFSVFSVSLW